MKVKCSQCGKMFDTRADLHKVPPHLVDWLCSDKCRAAWDKKLKGL